MSLNILMETHLELLSKDTKPSDTKGLNSSLIISDLSKPMLDFVLMGFECQLDLQDTKALGVASFPLFFFKSQQSDINAQVSYRSKGSGFPILTHSLI